MNNEFLSLLNQHKSDGVDVVIATLVKVRGSAPQEVGAKIIISQKGAVFGTIGGGRVEVKTITHAQDMLASSIDHDFLEWNLQTDVAMTCGGVVSLFFEKIKSTPTWNIAVFGAGHVAQELVRLLLKLDCQITCVDPRQDWLNKLPDNNKLTRILNMDMKQELKNLKSDSFIVSMTMGHSYDIPILIEAMNSFNFPYIGVIGSEGKSKIIKSDLLSSGISQKTIDRLFCPIGEPIGSNHPTEIAFSIVAQLLKVRDAK